LSEVEPQRPVPQPPGLKMQEETLDNILKRYQYRQKAILTNFANYLSKSSRGNPQLTALATNINQKLANLQEINESLLDKFKTMFSSQIDKYAKALENEWSSVLRDIGKLYKIPETNPAVIVTKLPGLAKPEDLQKITKFAGEYQELIQQLKSPTSKTSKTSAAQPSVKPATQPPVQTQEQKTENYKNVTNLINRYVEGAEHYRQKIIESERSDLKKEENKFLTVPFLRFDPKASISEATKKTEADSSVEPSSQAPADIKRILAIPVSFEKIKQYYLGIVNGFRNLISQIQHYSGVTSDDVLDLFNALKEGNATGFFPDDSRRIFNQIYYLAHVVNGYKESLSSRIQKFKRISATEGK